ncbi:shikimate dehydrogenase [Moraxella caviae]|uniref:Shikimate dehydrogenase (NADP(+)) n=1 Tax=Moraxella caviae TaxID=34060 RepID=A0A1T0A4X7_9GAMM|nr:shikimate dehydrogenase [Moraxella caviae]OOR90823.1 shikimate dehydrogenase [Moraxella caviae]STZ10652.1 Shikimate dehydrogenase [Moraxella caviae]VEW10559.1 Shikimate dehydrogenase [Moraxella caviae]
MQHFIVIGNPIAHSKSPQIHHAFAESLGLNIRYSRQFCPDDAASFTAVVEAFFHGGGAGANVTLPFKEIAFSLCQNTGVLSEYAKSAGAVNTLVIKDGKLFGDNTDGRGLVADLVAQGVNLQGAHVAIVGAGGATRGAILPLVEHGAALTIFNRTLAKAQTLADEFAAHTAISIKSLESLGADTAHFDVIINATSATTHGTPLTLAPTLSADFAYDMMYGKPSPFLAHFANQGARTSDGYGMLIHQAALAFTLWTGRAVDLQKVDL